MRLRTTAFVQQFVEGFSKFTTKGVDCWPLCECVDKVVRLLHTAFSFFIPKRKRVDCYIVVWLVSSRADFVLRMKVSKNVNWRMRCPMFWRGCSALRRRILLNLLKSKKVGHLTVNYPIDWLCDPRATRKLSGGTCFVLASLTVVLLKVTWVWWGMHLSRTNAHHLLGMPTTIRLWLLNCACYGAVVCKRWCV